MKLYTRVVICVSDLNALREIQDCFTWVNNTNKDVRAIVLAGEGDHFRYNRFLSCFPISQVFLLKIRCSIFSYQYWT